MELSQPSAAVSTPPQGTTVAPGGRHIGDLTRSDVHWQVYLETRPQGQLVNGRVHFVSTGTMRTTGWIFLEWSDADTLNRFNEFSPVELWKLLESLG